MDELQARLDTFSAALNTALAVGRFADEALPITDNAGRRWVVPALAEETVGTLLERVRKLGGYANVFVLEGTTVVALAMLDVVGALPRPDADDLGGVDPTRAPAADAAVGMLVDFLRAHPEGVLLPAALPSADDRGVQIKDIRELAFA